jgi:4'-phosphopantetheinyl transferase
MSMQHHTGEIDLRAALASARCVLSADTGPALPTILLFRTWTPTPEETARWSAWLAPDERARMLRFRFERDRTTFLLARAVLRRLLADRVGTTPDAPRFAYNDYGKPSLVGAADLQFNVSHTDGVVAIALSHCGRIGIDVEHAIRERAAFEAARQFFAVSECLAIERAPEQQRHATFFRLWTAKEAYIKARERGLSLGLDTFEVELVEGAAPRLRSQSGEDPGTWHLHQGEVFGDWVWAVAHEPTSEIAQPLRLVTAGAAGSA